MLYLWCVVFFPLLVLILWPPLCFWNSSTKKVCAEPWSESMRKTKKLTDVTSFLDQHKPLNIEYLLPQESCGYSPHPPPFIWILLLVFGLLKCFAHNFSSAHIFYRIECSVLDSEILGRCPKGLYFENTKVRTRFYCPYVREHACTPFFFPLYSVFFFFLLFFCACISSIFDLFDVIFAKAARFPSFMRSIFNRIFLYPLFFLPRWFFSHFFLISCISRWLLQEVAVMFQFEGIIRLFISGSAFAASEE